MNNTFSLRRFYLLFRKYIRENMGNVFLYTLGIALIMFVIYGVLVASSFHSSFPNNSRTIMYTVGLMMGGAVYTSSFYKAFGKQATSIQFLNLPASSFEKLVLGIVFTHIIYVVCYISLFALIDSFMCSLYNSRVSIPEEFKQMKMTFLFHAKPMQLMVDATSKSTIMIYWCLSSFMLFGSIRFNQHAFIKSIAIWLIFMQILGTFNYRSLLWMIPDKIMPHGATIFDSFRIDSTAGTTTGIVALPEGWFNMLYLLTFGGATIFCLLAAHFKLKEKQV